MRDQKPRFKVERLLRENDLSLLKAIDICRAAEVSREQVKSLSDKTPANIDAVHKDGQRHLPYTPPIEEIQHENALETQSRKPAGIVQISPAKVMSSLQQNMQQLW